MADVSQEVIRRECNKTCVFLGPAGQVGDIYDYDDYVDFRNG